MPRLSIYFPTGAFDHAYERFRRGEPQAYASHDELMRLVHSLLDRGVSVRFTSLVGPAPCRSEPVEGFEVVQLGASAFDERPRLEHAVESDPSDHLVGHFPSVALMRAMLSTDARLMMVLADSFNKRTARARYQTARMVRRLRSDRFEWVANHCEPSTRHLAALGVPEHKLLAWDVPHASAPHDRPPRAPRASPPHVLFVAGAVSVDKGVGDLVEAVGILARQGIDVRALLAGDGDIADMRGLAERVGVIDRVEFLGTVPNDAVLGHMVDADVVVVPSRHSYPEGLPLTIFEALASRTPIVSSDHPMFVTHLVDGVSACTFRGGDPESLAGAVTRLLSNPSLYRALSERATTTFAELGRGTCDYSTMIREWVSPSDPMWLARHSLAAERS